MSPYRWEMVEATLKIKGKERSGWGKEERDEKGRDRSNSSGKAIDLGVRRPITVPNSTTDLMCELGQVSMPVF